MEVQAITKFKFQGKEYTSLKEIQDTLHNTIGEELLDQMQRQCPLEKFKDYDILLKLICSPDIRKMLLEVLDVTFVQVDEDGEETEINILDLK